MQSVVSVLFVHAVLLQGLVFRPSLTHIISGSRPVLGLTSFGNQLFVIRSDSNPLAVYDTSTFELIANIAVPGASGYMFGITTCLTENCLYVCDHQNEKVHRLNVSLAPGSNTSTTSWSVASRPNGVSIGKGHNVLVAHARRIQEYRPSGSFVREIIDSNWLWHAVEHLNETIAVSRRGPVHGVFLMSVDGQILRSYGNATPGSGKGQMNKPLTMAVDKQGFILVAEHGNNRILVLEPTLSDARPLPLPTHLTGQINGPMGLWLDEFSGRLYVGEQKSPYRVLVYDNVFNLQRVFNP